MSFAGMIDQLQSRRRQAAVRHSSRRTWPVPKDEFGEELSKRLRTLIEEIDLLQHFVAERSLGGQSGFNERLLEMGQKAIRLRRALGTYSQEEGQVWSHFRLKAEDRCDELQQEFLTEVERYRGLGRRAS